MIPASRSGSVVVPAITAISEKEPIPTPEPDEEDKKVEPRRRFVGFAVEEESVQRRDEEAGDTVGDLSSPPGHGRSRRHTFSVGGPHPPRPMYSLDWLQQDKKVANPTALAEDRDDLEELPDMFASARRGSLLYWLITYSLIWSKIGRKCGN